MFGFLEFEDDPEILPPLLEAAAAWLRAHGRDRMIGPMDFTMNDESGVLIEGFEREPMIKQPWHPPYYQRLLRGGRAGQGDGPASCGSSRSPTATKILPIIFKLAEQVEPRHGITILRKMSRRSLRKRHGPLRRGLQRGLERELGLRRPTRKKDLDAYAQEMQLVFDRNWFMVAETRRGRDGGGRDHGARHQPGAREDERPAAAARLVALPAQGQDHRPRARRLPRRQARATSTPGVAGALYVEHFDTADAHAADVGRDGLDPRDQHAT